MELSRRLRGCWCVTGCGRVWELKPPAVGSGASHLCCAGSLFGLQPQSTGTFRLKLSSFKCAQLTIKSAAVWFHPDQTSSRKLLFSKGRSLSGFLHLSIWDNISANPLQGQSVLVLDNFLPLFIHPSCWCHFLLLAPNSDLSFTTHSGNVLVLPGIRCPGEYPLLYLGRIPPAGGRLLMYLNPKGICAQRSFFILNPYYHLSSPFFFFLTVIYLFIFWSWSFPDFRGPIPLRWHAAFSTFSAVVSWECCSFCWQEISLMPNESVMFIQLSVPFSEVSPRRLFRRHHTISHDDKGNHNSFHYCMCACTFIINSQSCFFKLKRLCELVVLARLWFTHTTCVLHSFCVCSAYPVGLFSFTVVVWTSLQCKTEVLTTKAAVLDSFYASVVVYSVWVHGF